MRTRTSGGVGGAQRGISAALYPDQGVEPDGRPRTAARSLTARRSADGGHLVQSAISRSSKYWKFSVFAVTRVRLSL
jgi:hypothetical protein